jgi:cysteine-rich repeat protein
MAGAPRLGYRQPVSTFTSRAGACLLLLGLCCACVDWDKLQHGRCGDGFVGPEESCDDRNAKSGDGCSASCQIEPSMCGNDRKEPGEACDDGNTKSGDGCSAQCDEEPPLPPGPRCGDGKVDGDGGVDAGTKEACDDGNTSNSDACLKGCSRATCGDGFVRVHVEECDVEPSSDGTPCTPACLACGEEPGAFFRAVNRHCFVHHNEALTQAEARARCQDEGGDLWTITASDEGDTAVTRMELTGSVWLGLAINGKNRSWVTGEAFSFENFAANEPPAMPPGCATLLADGGDNSWHASACNKQLPFVCERGAPIANSTDFTTSEAWRVHTHAVTAADARVLCKQEGGALVAIETESERAFLAARLTLRTWVDASEISENKYEWSTGVPVDPTLFRTGQPDDTDGTQACLALEPKKRLSDEKCDELNSYVCEFK